MFYAFGVNQYNMNNKASVLNKDCIHAEVDCINRLKKSEKVVPINLLVFRTNNSGSNLMNAKPCMNCINAINFTLRRKNYRLKKLSYTNEIGEICVLC